MQAMIYENKFLSFWGNKLSDNFLTATIKNMNWDKLKLKMFSFDEYEKAIGSFGNDHKIVCNENGKLDISQVTTTKKSVKKSIFAWEEGAKGLFTDEEIEQATINHFFLIDNPDTPSADLPYPMAPMVAREKWVLEDVETLVLVVSYQGVNVDIEAKLLEEKGETVGE